MPLPTLLLALALLAPALHAAPLADPPTAVLAEYFEAVHAAGDLSELLPYLNAEAVAMIEEHAPDDPAGAAAYLADIKSRAPHEPEFVMEVIEGNTALVSYQHAGGGGVWVLELEDGVWKVVPG
jgi:hypothetical protein